LAPHQDGAADGEGQLDGDEQRGRRRRAPHPAGHRPGGVDRGEPDGEEAGRRHDDECGGGKQLVAPMRRAPGRLRARLHVAILA